MTDPVSPAASSDYCRRQTRLPVDELVSRNRPDTLGCSQGIGLKIRWQDAAIFLQAQPASLKAASQTLLATRAAADETMEQPQRITQANAYDESGFWSRLWMAWMFPLLNRGFVKDLQPEDLYTCSSEDDPGVMADALER